MPSSLDDGVNPLDIIPLKILFAAFGDTIDPLDHLKAGVQSFFTKGGGGVVLSLHTASAFSPREFTPAANGYIPAIEKFQRLYNEDMPGHANDAGKALGLPKVPGTKRHYYLPGETTPDGRKVPDLSGENIGLSAVFDLAAIDTKKPTEMFSVAPPSDFSPEEQKARREALWKIEASPSEADEIMAALAAELGYVDKTREVANNDDVLFLTPARLTLSGRKFDITGARVGVIYGRGVMLMLADGEGMLDMPLTEFYANGVYVRPPRPLSAEDAALSAATDALKERNAEASRIIGKLGAELGYTRNVTGDAATGDEVIFARARFSGSFRKPRFDGYDILRGEIVADSYGEKKQQHTFTVVLSTGERTFIKGRNLYRNGVFAKPRSEEERKAALDDKHERGRAARYDRRRRREGYSAVGDGLGDELPPTETEEDVPVNAVVEDDEEDRETESSDFDRQLPNADKKASKIASLRQDNSVLDVSPAGDGERGGAAAIIAAAAANADGDGRIVLSDSPAVRRALSAHGVKFSRSAGGLAVSAAALRAFAPAALMQTG